MLALGTLRCQALASATSQVSSVMIVRGLVARLDHVQLGQQPALVGNVVEVAAAEVASNHADFILAGLQVGADVQLVETRNARASCGPDRRSPIGR